MKLALDHVNVLVVEDDPDTREVLRTVLEQHHASVSAAASSLMMETAYSIRAAALSCS